MKALQGKHVVVTGVIAGESRATATAKLQDAGAVVQSTVNSSTDLLVIGERVGEKKMAAARDLGIEVVPWATFWERTVDAVVKGERPAVTRYEKAVEAAVAKQIAPQLAKGATAVPAGTGWLFEVKWDGFRGVATVKDGRVYLQSRSGKTNLVGRFPKVAAALAQLPDCVLDGELLDLAAQMKGDEAVVSLNGGGEDYVVFDLLEYQGQNVRHLPLDARRTMLEQFLERDTSLIVSDFPVHLSPAFTDGQELLDYVDAHGLEGVVAKQRNSSYREGTRTGAWLKIKVRREQEFVVVGWTPGEGARLGLIGSLVLAVNEGTLERRYVYCGRVGSGVGPQTAESFGLEEADAPAVDNPKDAPKGTTWVVPELVVQVAFQRWTEDGRLWHPSFKGVRDDKLADDVVREVV